MIVASVNIRLLNLSRFRAFSEDRYDWPKAGVPDALTAEMEKAQREKEKEKKKRMKAKKAEQEQLGRMAQIEQKASTALASSASAGVVLKPKKEESVCEICKSPLTKKNSVDVFDKKVCSPECALKMRRKVQAEAAEARLKATAKTSS
jgi:hypothetical protein